MNQIPNIEETHNTREVEEIIEEKIKGYYEDIEQHERTKQAIKNKEIVYIGEFGNVLCEEDYFAWEEWVDSVAIGGSSREKFIKVNLNLHQQLQKAREEERERIKALKTCKRCTKCYRCTCQHYIQPTTCTSHNMRHTFETTHSELDQDDVCEICHGFGNNGADDAQCLNCGGSGKNLDQNV